MFVVLFLAGQTAGHLWLVALGAANSLTWYSVVSLIAAVGPGLLLLVALERRPAGDLGFAVRQRTTRELAFGVAIPALALLAVVVLLGLFGAWRYVSDRGSVLGWFNGNAQLLLLLLIAAAAEEALFRGYPFQKLVEIIGPALATISASAAFAVMHGNNPAIGMFALLNIFLAGVVLSIAYLKTGSLWFATAVHLGWNWQMAGPLDLPVSGLELFDAPLYEPQPLGSSWLTGGAFGPEGGLAGLIALMLVTAGVWWYTGKFEHV